MKRFNELIIKTIIHTQYWLLNAIIDFFAFILFPSKKIKNVKKILIFRTGSLGDSICALPAIYSIRKNFPDTQIDILINPGAENLVSLSVLIDKTIVNEIINYFGVNKNLLFKKLRKNKYDLFIQLPQYDAKWFRQIRDILIAKALGVNYAFGWQIGATRFLARYQEKLIKFENERDRLLKILEKHGLRNYGMFFPLGISDETKDRIFEIMKIKKLEDKNLNVGMVVGAKHHQNLWPIEYFKEVADYLLKKGYNIILFGGPEDNERAKQITGENIFNYCGKLTPLETAEMMKYCKIVISIDTGPMHLAYAVGTRVIAIFSGREYSGKWFPPEENFIFRTKNIICVDCLNYCRNNHVCLRAIKPAEIIDTMNKMFNIVNS